MKLEGLTPALKKTYAAVIVLRERLGRRPTQQEIAHERGLKAKSTICVQLRRLHELGYVVLAYDTVECVKV